MPKLTKDAIETIYNEIDNYVSLVEESETTYAGFFNDAYKEAISTIDFEKLSVSELFKKRDEEYYQAFLKNNDEEANKIKEQHIGIYNRKVASLTIPFLKMQYCMEEILETKALELYKNKNNKELADDEEIPEEYQKGAKEFFKEQVEEFSRIKGLILKKLDVKKEEYDEMLNVFKNIRYNNGEETIKNYINKLDNDLEDNIDEIKKRADETLKSIEDKEEENNRIQQERQEKINTNTKRIDEIYNYTFGNKFNFDMAEESVNFFEGKVNSFDREKTFEKNVLDKVNDYLEISNRLENNRLAENDDVEKSNISVRLNESYALTKKFVIGGYVKIKEHFDSKNIFVKLFTLPETIREWKAMKELSSRIEDRYHIQPDALKEIADRCIQAKKERELLAPQDVPEIANVNRNHSPELEDNLNESINGPSLATLVTKSNNTVTKEKEETKTK